MGPSTSESPKPLYPCSSLLTSLLRDVSRTFYWTMRVLPSAIRRQVGLAYLLARAADTIADTQIVPVAQRLGWLRALRKRILQESHAQLEFASLITSLRGAATPEPGAPAKGSTAERVLLERIESVLALLDQFSPPDQQLIRRVLSIITSGQELDLRRFGEIEPGQLGALQVDQELEDYIYRVAGCVGEFWTYLCRAHLFPQVPLDGPHLLTQGVRFGKGLQLVNVLRDLPADLRQGRCYIPSASLIASGLTPADLLHPENEPQFRPVYNQYLAAAADHLAAGWEYTNLLPRRCFRVRLACAWPLLIGVKTLARLRTENILDASRRVKISRAEVKRLMLGSCLASVWPPAWNRLFEKAAGTG